MKELVVRITILNIDRQFGTVRIRYETLNGALGEVNLVPGNTISYSHELAEPEIATFEGAAAVISKARSD